MLIKFNFLKRKERNQEKGRKKDKKNLKKFLIIINFIIVLLIIFLLMNIVYFNFNDGKDLEKAKEMGIVKSIFYSPFRNNFIITINAIPEAKIIVDDLIHLNKQIGVERFKIFINKGLKSPENFSIFLIHFYSGDSWENGINVVSIDLKNPSDYYILNLKECDLLKIRIEISSNSRITKNFQDTISLSISPG